MFLADLAGDRYRAFNMENTSPQELDRRYRETGKILKHVAEIDLRLDKIQREGATIKKHCTATPDEIRAEAEKHAKHLQERDALEMFDNSAAANFGRAVLAEAMKALPAHSAATLAFRTAEMTVEQSVGPKHQTPANLGTKGFNGEVGFAATVRLPVQRFRHRSASARPAMRDCAPICCFSSCRSYLAEKIYRFRAV